MKTLKQILGAETKFILTDLSPEYIEAAKSLFYLPDESGFSKTFPSDYHGIDRVYEHFQNYAESMILQALSAIPIPWDKALLHFLETIETTHIRWWLTGSAALAVRGLRIIPHDIDIVVDGADAESLGTLLFNDLIEPVIPSQNWISDWFGRAFAHARIEWVGGVHASVDDPHATDFGPTAASRLEKVTWNRKEINVPPLELQLQTSERRGLSQRAEEIRKWMLKR
jgi:hypothetical protein